MRNRVPYFDGVQLFDIRKFDLPGYYGLFDVPHAAKLKWVYMDLFDKYAFFWSNGMYMPFHDWLRDLVIDSLGRGNCIYKYSGVRLTTPTPDIIFHDSYIEIETGLKKSYSDLKRRLYRSKPFVYVLVPNKDIKKRYFVHLKQFHGRIYTFKEFFTLNNL